jgi:hypothetical protein
MFSLLELAMNLINNFKISIENRDLFVIKSVFFKDKIVMRIIANKLILIS